MSITRLSMQDGQFVELGQVPAQSPAQAQASGPSSRVYDGITRVGMESGQSSESGITRHTTNGNPGTSGGSVMATRQYSGRTETVELVPGVPGTRTTIAAALREGVIRQAPSGAYEDVAGQPEAIASSMAQAQALAENPQEPQQGPAGGSDVFDAEDSRQWAEAVADIPQHAFDSTAANLVLAVATGQTGEKAAQRLAQETGMEPALARSYVEAGYAVHERAVARAVAPLGIDEGSKQEFYGWLQANHPGKLQQAVQMLLHARDAQPFRDLAVQFKRANPGDLSAWTRAGFETSMPHDGELLVRHGKGDWVKASDLGRHAASASQAQQAQAAVRRAPAQARPVFREMTDEESDALLPGGWIR